MMRYEPLLAALSAQYQAILQDNLAGIYIHGSIAFGCFNWAKSDIDLIVVVHEPLTQHAKLALLQVLEDLRAEAPEKGFEMSVVLKRHCLDFQHPSPFELHFSEAWHEAYLQNPLSLCAERVQTDPDLAAHFTVILHAGRVLYGEPIPDVFGPVPAACYLDSIWQDVENAQEDVRDAPMYIALNLCRVLAYVEEGLVLSKEEGGSWGMAHLPPAHAAFVGRMLDSYRSADAPIADESAAAALCDHMLRRIRAGLPAAQRR